MKFRNPCIVIYTVIAICFIISSCAKLPVESVALTQYIADEGERMHQLNILLINAKFAEKRVQIDEFIQKEYLLTLLKPAFDALDKDDDPKEVIPVIINLAISKLEARRSQMKEELESVRVQLITKTQENYQDFSQATFELKKLLKSAIKVNEERGKLLDEVKSFSKNKIDLNMLDATFDNYLSKGGKAGELILNMNEILGK